MSAPARLNPVRVSRTTRRSSIQPSGGGGLDHRVFARDVVGRHRDAEPLLDPPDDVEVRQRGLDHDEVGPFRQVERDLAQRLVAVGRVHLVRPAIAEGRRALGRIAEGAIIGAGELGGIRQDRQAREARAVESRADRGDHPVHHPRRGDHVGPRAGMADRLLGEERQGRVVVDVDPPAPIHQRAAMPMVGVLAEADVGDDQQARRLPLHEPDRLLDDPRLLHRGRPPRILMRGDAEEEDGRDPQLGHLRDPLAQPVERVLILAGHRRDLAAQVRAVVDEHRVDQVIQPQPFLTHQVAKPRMAPEPPRSMEREAGRGRGSQP